MIISSVCHVLCFEHIASFDTKGTLSILHTELPLLYGSTNKLWFKFMWLHVSTCWPQPSKRKPYSDLLSLNFAIHYKTKLDLIYFAY